MRIELDLPDWHEDRHIRIFYGVELVAMKPQGVDYWRIKVDRCNGCGKCCEIPPSKKEYRDMPMGRCEFLKKDGNRFVCDIAFDRMQCFGDPIGLMKSGDCSITHKVVKVK